MGCRGIHYGQLCVSAICPENALSLYLYSKNITGSSDADSEWIFVMCDFAVGRSCQISNAPACLSFPPSPYQIEFCTLPRHLSFSPSFSSCTIFHTLFIHSVSVVHAACLVEDDRRLSYCDKPLFRSFLDRDCLDLSFLIPLSAILEPADPIPFSSLAHGDGRYTGQ